MAKVSSSIETELYKIDIKSPTGNVVIADEPIDKGGKNLGFSPKELLAASLAGARVLPFECMQIKKNGHWRK